MGRLFGLSVATIALLAVSASKVNARTYLSVSFSLFAFP
jgi:hypothetical protein